jgi:hypothetical protein
MRSTNQAIRGFVVLGVSGAVIAGCAAGPSTSASPVRSYSSNATPTPTQAAPSTPAGSSPAAQPPVDQTTRPPQPAITEKTGPPRDPTDSIKKTNLVVGVVTRGGSGPCFGLRTDDGTDYALYSVNPLTLTHGTYVKVRTRTAKVRIDCGPGKFLEITALEP